MSISPVKRLILETMWMIDKPARPAEIAKDTGVSFKQAWMHLLGLTKMECVSSPEKGFYVITGKGKKTLGIPEIEKQRAIEILAYLPMEKSFHFYADLGKPLNVFAASLGDFRDKIQKIDAGSIEFHIRRGDFEVWFTSLGDIELARKTLLTKERKMSGEELRKKLHEIVGKRLEELVKIRNS
jgi:hypothetical protein